jgi:hypothetical protein
MELEQIMQALREANRRAQQGDAQAALDASRLAQMASQHPDYQAPSEPQAPSLAGDLAMSAGSGLARGVTGLADLPGAITGWLGAQSGRLVEPVYEYFSGEDLPTEFYTETARQAIERISPFAPGGQTLTGAASEVAPETMAYEPQTTTGRFTQRIAENVPGALIPIGGVSLPARLGWGAVAPGAMGEGTEIVAEDLGMSPEAAQLAGVGAEIFGPMASSALAGGLRSAAIGPEARALEAGSERARSVAQLENLGITDMTVGQRLGSERLMRLEGVEAGQRDTILDLNRYLMRQLGSTAERPTREALGEVGARLGSVFDEAEALIEVVPSQNVRDRIYQSVVQYLDDTGRDELTGTLNRVTESIINSIDNGVPVTQTQLQNWRAEIRPILQSSANPRTEIPIANTRLATDLMEALNEIVIEGARQTADPTLYRRLMDARSDYRDYMTVINAMRRSGGATASSGLVTPNALYGEVSRREGTRLLSQRPGQVLRPISQAAAASREVLGDLDRVPSGGVRFSPRGPEMGVLAGLIGMNADNIGPLGVAGMAAGGYLAPSIGQAALRSTPGQRALTGPLGIIPGLERGMLYGFPAAANEPAGLLNR